MDNNKSKDIRTRLRLISFAILAIGAVSAVAIYWSAANAPEDSGYEILGENIYPGGGYDKKYVHDLQLYGGSAAVLSDQFMRWFNGLWHGTQLAYTVAVIAVVLSFVTFVVANNISPQSHSNFSDDNPDASA